MLNSKLTMICKISFQSLFYVYFSSFLNIISIIQIEKSIDVCAWDLNPRPYDGRRRRYHKAVAAAQLYKKVSKPIAHAYVCSIYFN